MRVSSSSYICGVNGLAYYERVHRPRTIENIIKRINEEYGGVDAYVKGDIGLTDEDIATIRKNLLIS